MTMKPILVPAYAADRFNRPLSHPGTRPDAVNISVERVYRLINEALKDLDGPDWEIGGTQYHSSKRDEPCGLERIDDKFYIYEEERGRRTALAIFRSSHMAAK